jgi:hypothetical protein
MDPQDFTVFDRNIGKGTQSTKGTAETPEDDHAVAL